MSSSQQLKFICNLTSITHEPYHPPFTLSSYISHHFIYHHFPHCRVTNIQSSQTCHSYRITLIAFILLLTSDCIQFSSHILVSKSLYSSIAHCFCFSFHFLHQPFAIFTCISFHFIYQPYDHHYQHATETNTLFILNYFMSSSHCIPLLLLSFCFVIPMGEQYSFSFLAFHFFPCSS